MSLYVSMFTRLFVSVICMTTGGGRCETELHTCR